jgi:hypothetical protein
MEEDIIAVCLQSDLSQFLIGVKKRINDKSEKSEGQHLAFAAEFDEEFLKNTGRLYRAAI